MKRKATEVIATKQVVPRGVTTRAAAAATATTTTRAAAAATAATTTATATTTGSAATTVLAVANAATADVVTAADAAFNHLDVLSLILSLVGPHQYRFVAPVSSKFRTAYAHTFHNETITSFNTCSVAHAKICAAELNRANLIKWNDSNEEPNVLVIASRSAAKHNNLALLQYLRAEGCPWDAALCSKAAENGHYELLKWLHANDCPWDEFTSAAVADRGDLDMLKWLIEEEGCAGDWSLYAAAAEHGHLDVLKWAFSKDDMGFGYRDCVDGIYWSSRYYKQAHITEWLEQQIEEGNLYSEEYWYQDTDSEEE